MRAWQSVPDRGTGYLNVKLFVFTACCFIFVICWYSVVLHWLPKNAELHKQLNITSCLGGTVINPPTLLVMLCQGSFEVVPLCNGWMLRWQSLQHAALQLKHCTMICSSLPWLRSLVNSVCKCSQHLSACAQHVFSPVQALQIGSWTSSPPNMCKLTAPFVQLTLECGIVYFTAASLCIQKFDLQTHWRGFWVSFNTSCTMGPGCSTEQPLLCLSILSYSLTRKRYASLCNPRACIAKESTMYIHICHGSPGPSFLCSDSSWWWVFCQGRFTSCSSCIYLHAPIFSMFPWCIQIDYQHLPNGIAATPSHPLATSRYIFSCHNNSFRFPEAGPASSVFDLSWCYHMCRCLGRATKVWPRVAGLEQQMLACPGRRVNQAKQLSHKDEASD